MNIDPIFLAWLAPVVMALVEGAKRTFAGLRPGETLSRAWLPALAMVMSLLAAGVACLSDPPNVATWWEGLGYWALHALIAGLGASGLYAIAGGKVIKRVFGPARKSTT